MTSLSAHQKALERIYECQEFGESTLDISKLGLTQIPHEIGQCQNLISLNCDDNQISDLTPLAQCQQLTELRCIRNQISDLTPLVQCQQLTSLDCGGNQISDLAPLAQCLKLKRLFCGGNQISDLTPLAQCQQLTELNCMDNQISDLTPLAQCQQLTYLSCIVNQIIDLTPLAQCQRLTALNCGHNQISDLTPLAQCQRLTEFNCMDNQISDLTPLAQCQNLTRLGCRNNKIVDLTPLAQCQNLTRLYCGSNQIVDLTPLAQCQNLTRLDCRSNQIVDLTPLAQCQNLIYLDCDVNQIVDLTPLAQCQKLESFRGADNPVTNPPLEVVRQGLRAVRDYFARAEQKEVFVPLHEVKLMLVGSPGAGKTTLRRRILGEDIPEEELGTPGIDMEVWQFKGVGGSTYRVNIWDFAGQQINYSLHELFYSARSIFIVLLDGRTEDQPRDWLERIRLLAGEQARILLVRNKIDDKGGFHPIPPFNMQELCRDYSDLDINEALFSVSARQGDGCDDLLKCLRQTVVEHPQTQERYPQSYLEVKAEIEEKTAVGRNHIDYGQYQEICAKHGVRDTEQDSLLGVLRDLGVITFFETADLASRQILNPEWLSAATYKLLRASEQDSANGLLRRSDFNQYLQADPQRDCERQLVWHEHDYPWIEAMMVQYLQMLALPDDQTGPRFLLPRGLHSIDRPPFDEACCIHFHFKYKILPSGLFSRLIAKTFSYCVQAYYGSNFLLLQRDQSQALFSVNEKTLVLQINAPNANDTSRFDFLSVLRNEVALLNQSYQAVDNCKEFVPLLGENGDTSELRYKAIKNKLKSKKKNYWDDGIEKEFNLLSLLGLPDSASVDAVGKMEQHNYYGPVTITRDNATIQQNWIGLEPAQIEAWGGLDGALRQLLSSMPSEVARQVESERKALRLLSEKTTAIQSHKGYSTQEKEAVKTLLQKAKGILASIRSVAQGANDAATLVESIDKVGKFVQPIFDKLPF